MRPSRGRLAAEEQESLQNACMTSITVRNIPEETGAELAARAARSGRSLQEFLRSHVVELADRPDHEELFARIRDHKERTGSRLDARTILEARDADRR